MHTYTCSGKTGSIATFQANKINVLFAKGAGGLDIQMLARNPWWASGGEFSPFKFFPRKKTWNVPFVTHAYYPRHSCQGMIFYLS